MAGEFGLGLLMPPDGQTSDPSNPDAPAQPRRASQPPAPVPNPALAFLVEASDPAAATATFKTASTPSWKSAIDFLSMPSSWVTFAVTRWTSPFNSLTLSYGWLEGDVLFFTVGEGVAPQLAPRTGSLPGDK